MKTKKCYGVFCQAALDINPNALPRYEFATKKQAEEHLPVMNRECASKAKHFVKLLKPKPTRSRE